MKPLNLLPILSPHQQPDPRTEVERLAELARQNKTVYLATTRQVKDLARGVSEVAVYEDSEPEFPLLASGIFREFVDIEQPAALTIIGNSALYATETERPDTTRGLIGLSSFRLAPRNSSLKKLNGILLNGRPMSVDSLPEGRRRNAIFYFKNLDTFANITDLERVKAYESKIGELEDKVSQLDKLWRTERRLVSEKAATIQNLLGATDTGVRGGRRVSPSQKKSHRHDRGPAFASIP